MTLYRETPCEHGEFNGWHLVTWGDWCNSVVREEVTIDIDGAKRAGPRNLEGTSSLLSHDEVLAMIDAALGITQADKESASTV